MPACHLFHTLPHIYVDASNNYSSHIKYATSKAWTNAMQLPSLCRNYLQTKAVLCLNQKQYCDFKYSTVSGLPIFPCHCGFG